MAGAPPTMPSKAVGDKVTASDYLNFTKAAIDALSSPDRVHAYQTAVTTLATSGAWQVIAFDSELYDTNSMHSTVSNTSRVVATVTGLYQVNVNVTFASNATGVRFLDLRKNAAGVQTGGSSVGSARVHSVTANAAPVGFTVDVPLTAGDYLEVFGFQSSGGSLSTAAGSVSTYLQMRWVASS